MMLIARQCSQPVQHGAVGDDDPVCIAGQIPQVYTEDAHATRGHGASGFGEG